MKMRLIFDQAPLNDFCSHKGTFFYFLGAEIQIIDMVYFSLVLTLIFVESQI